ncbi:MAG: cytochrome d ubiquinol oxidase subunit II [Vulcanimicrobiaceae bacterium]
MIVVAFIVLALMLGTYVLLDGYDLGVGTIHLFVTRTDAERAATIASIGPFWNGNEVWLIAAGGTLFGLFPLVYASSFSGFYLPFMVVLWLLMFRGIALELRGHYASELWHQFFDVTFAVASALLALLFGVALGNVVRGVPLDAQHYFKGTFAFLLNPYAVGVGLLAVLALAMHGAAWVALRVEGAPAERAARALRIVWPIVLLFTVALTYATFRVHSPWPNLLAMPWIALAPLASAVGLLGVAVLREQPRRTFAASSLFLAGLLASAAATLFPYLLPGFPVAEHGLSVYTATVPPATLATMLPVIIIGIAIVGAYRAFVAGRLDRGSRGSA